MSTPSSSLGGTVACLSIYSSLSHIVALCLFVVLSSAAALLVFLSLVVLFHRSWFAQYPQWDADSSSARSSGEDHQRLQPTDVSPRGLQPDSQGRLCGSDAEAQQGTEEGCETLLPSSSAALLFRFLSLYFEFLRHVTLSLLSFSHSLLSGLRVDLPVRCSVCSGPVSCTKRSDEASALFVFSCGHSYHVGCIRTAIQHASKAAEAAAAAAASAAPQGGTVRRLGAGNGAGAGEEDGKDKDRPWCVVCNSRTSSTVKDFAL
jgi:hypothetical protein